MLSLNSVSSKLDKKQQQQIMQVKIVAAAASQGNDVMGSAQTEWNVFLVSSIKYITVGIILRQLQGSTSRKVICRKINDSSHIAKLIDNPFKWLVLMYPLSSADLCCY